MIGHFRQRWLSMVEADDAEAEDTVAAYAARLARAILVASAALKRGEVDYARGVLSLFETKIRAGIAAMESEYATKH